MITTLTSREHNQDPGRAKRAAKVGPVFITDRGKPSHVLLTIEQYQTLKGAKRSLIESLSMTESDAFEFEPPKINMNVKPVDMS